MATFKQYTKKDGTKLWMFQTYLGVDEATGKEKRTTRRNFKTKKEAQLDEARLQYEVSQNGFSNITILKFNDVYEMWFEQYQNTVKESTWVKTKEIFRLHILPIFGNLKMDKISVPTCQKAINKWFKKLGNYKVVMNYTAKIFDYAISLEMINDNPAKKVSIPIKKDFQEEKDLNFYNLEELKTFMKHVEETNRTMIYTFFRVLAYTGMRMGEVLALTWNDIDYEGKTVAITKTLARGENRRLLIQPTKTKSSTRIISVDDATLNILTGWHTEQKEQYFKLGFNTLKPKQLIFSNTNNEFLQLSKPRKWLNYIIDKYELKRVTLHGFRHTHCSLLFESDPTVTIKDVQDRLGHSDIHTTMNIYAHVTEKRKEDTASKFAKYVDG